MLALDVDKKTYLEYLVLIVIKSIEYRGIKRCMTLLRRLNVFFDDSFGVWVDNDRTKAEKSDSFF